MKRKIFSGILAVLTAATLFVSCKKNATAPNSTSSSNNSKSIAIGTNQSFAIAASSSDTLYVVNACHPGNMIDTLAAGSLPSTVTTYLTTNYSGYTFKKAYEVLNSSKTIEGYIAVIIYNGNPVALAFNASGAFTNVLEQCQKQDLRGPQGWWHEGGRFGDRDGHHPDTIAISKLPVIITSYFATTYPGDTIKHAFINPDSSYLVVSADTSVYLNIFSSTGTFIKRTQLYPHAKCASGITQAQLPANVTTYLTATYPGYVFNNAFEVIIAGTAKGYLVVITENSTKYVIMFDSSGNVQKTLTAR